MELRFVQTGVFYVPEYKSEEDEWKRFLKSTLEDLAKLKSVISQLTQVDLSISSSGFNYSFSKNTNELYFRSEMTCMAFLGAAKVQFTPREVEFKI